MTLSLGLLDAQSDGESIAVCTPMVAACAWLLGEYNSDLEEPEVGRRLRNCWRMNGNEYRIGICNMYFFIQLHIE